MRYRPHSGTGPDGSGPAVCAADRPAEYLARKESAEQTRKDRLGQGSAGSPLLAATLDKVEQIGRLQAEVVGHVTELVATGEAEQVTQLPLSTWLAMAGRLTRRETSLLCNGVDVLADMPNVASALQAGEIAWGQITRAIARLRGIRGEVRAKVDNALAEWLAPQLDWEPDELVGRIDRLIDAATPDREQADADDAHEREFLNIQPDLFGHHGRYYGEAPTETLTLFADTLDAIATRARQALPDAARRGLGDRPDGAGVAATMATRRARALSAWVFNPALACPGTHDTDSGDGEGGHDAGVQVDLRVIATLDSLLGRDGSPAEVLTSLTGRRLKITQPVLRQLLEHRGTNLTMMVIENHGQVIGVGGTNYQPPGWLRRIVETMWPHGIAPGRTTSAVTADLDHHIPWPHGLTNLDNLGPLARSDHGLKDTDGWSLQPHPKGWRRWVHGPSGMVIDKPPWTYQPRPPDLADLPADTARQWRKPNRTTDPPPPSDADAPPTTE